MNKIVVFDEMYILSHFNITVLKVIKLMHYKMEKSRGVPQCVTLLYDRVSPTEFTPLPILYGGTR